MQGAERCVSSSMQVRQCTNNETVQHPLVHRSASSELRFSLGVEGLDSFVEVLRLA